MSELDRKAAAFDRADMDRHARELHRVGERLKDLIVSMRRDREEREIQRRNTPAPLPAAHGAGRDDEVRQLTAELAVAHEALEQRRDSEERLRAEVVELERENRRACDEFVAIHEQHTVISNLCVALSRLHGSIDRKEVLAAIEEIVVNLVGSEEVAIYELAPGGGRLLLTHGIGVVGRAPSQVDLGAGVIGRAAESGCIYLAGAEAPCGPEDEDVSACVPLVLASRVIGAVVVFRLLGHKPGIDMADRELFRTLAHHGAIALHCASLAARVASA